MTLKIVGFFCDILNQCLNFTVLFLSTFKHIIENVTAKNMYIHVYVMVSHEGSGIVYNLINVFFLINVYITLYNVHVHINIFLIFLNLLFFFWLSFINTRGPRLTSLIWGTVEPTLIKSTLLNQTQNIWPIIYQLSIIQMVNVVRFFFVASLNIRFNILYN